MLSDDELRKQLDTAHSERLLSDAEVELIENIINDIEKKYKINSHVGEDAVKDFVKHGKMSEEEARKLVWTEIDENLLIGKYICNKRQIELVAIFHLLYNDLLPKISPFFIHPAFNNYRFSYSNALSDDEIKQILQRTESSIKEEVIILENKKNNSKNIYERQSFTKQIKRNQIKLNFLNDLHLLRGLLDRNNIHLDWQNLLIEIFYDCSGELELTVQFAHKSVVGGYGELECLNDRIFIKRIMRFWYDKRWINGRLQCPITVLWWLLMVPNKKIKDTTVIKIWDELSDDIILDNFERNIIESKKIDIPNFLAMRGNDFECFLKILFEKMGYHVTLTPNTKDQGADLILDKGSERIVVQAKLYSNQFVGNRAIQEIVAAKSIYNADRGMVVTNSSFTSSALELADANDIDLWDGDKLNEIIEFINSTF